VVPADGIEPPTNASPPRRGSKWLKMVGATLAVAFVVVVATTFAQAYMDMQDRSHVAQAVETSRAWVKAVTAYYEQNRRFPASWLELGESPSSSGDASFDGTVTLLPVSGDAMGYGRVTLGPNGALTVTLTTKAGNLAGQTVIVRPKLDVVSGKLEWDCNGGTLGAKKRPDGCRSAPGDPPEQSRIDRFGSKASIADQAQ
jgi:hypothetical protein